MLRRAPHQDPAAAPTQASCLMHRLAHEGGLPVVAVLRVMRFGEKEPALGNEPRVLDRTRGA
jgi:hypothetical protein